MRPFTLPDEYLLPSSFLLYFLFLSLFDSVRLFSVRISNTTFSYKIFHVRFVLVVPLLLSHLHLLALVSPPFSLRPFLPSSLTLANAAHPLPPPRRSSLARAASGVSPLRPPYKDINGGSYMQSDQLCLGTRRAGRPGVGLLKPVEGECEFSMD